MRVERALRRGPSGARVDDVVVETAAPTGRATGFSDQVRRRSADRLDQRDDPASEIDQ